MGQICNLLKCFKGRLLIAVKVVIWHKKCIKGCIFAEMWKNRAFSMFSFHLPYEMPPKPKTRTLGVSPKLSDLENLGRTSPYSLESSCKRSLETYLFDIKFVFQACYESCAPDRLVTVHIFRSRILMILTRTK